MKLRQQEPRKAIKPADLHRKVKNLNIRHNVDWDDPGYVWLETWRNNHSNTYRLMIRGAAGFIIGSSWMKASDMMQHLSLKDWRNVLKVARGDVRWPA